MKQRRKNIVVMVKPASGLCNMRCEYCFYRDEMEHRENGGNRIMSEETASALIMRIGEEAENAMVAFQGGEPSLAGLDFISSFLEKEKELAPDTVFTHAFQTNGYIIDEKWAAFFRENDFLVGVSFDGSRRIHDALRHGESGSRTADRVMETIRFLEKENVKFNVLIVVTKLVADNIESVWKYLIDRRIYFQQYIPCMDPIEGSGKNYSISSDDYRMFLTKLFDLWFDAFTHGLYVSVRHFDNYVSMLMGAEPEACDMAGHCSIQYVAESNGDIYPCDFYCMDGYRLGNINSEGFSVIDQRRLSLGFIESSFAIPEECSSCDAFILCRGGCRRFRDSGGRYRFCSAMKAFYEYAFPGFLRVSEAILRDQMGRIKECR